MGASSSPRESLNCVIMRRMSVYRIRLLAADCANPGVTYGIHREALHQRRCAMDWVKRYLSRAAECLASAEAEHTPPHFKEALLTSAEQYLGLAAFAARRRDAEWAKRAQQRTVQPRAVHSHGASDPFRVTGTESSWATWWNSDPPQVATSRQCGEGKRGLGLRSRSSWLSSERRRGGADHP